MGRRKKTKLFPKKYCTIDYLTCYEYNEKGQCIVNFNNKPFYIDHLIKGEEARILIFYEYIENGYGKAIMLKSPSKDRKLQLNHPKLELGTYQIAHLSDEAQDKFKQEWVEKVFKIKIPPIIVGKRTFYRNKVVLIDGGFKPPGKRRKMSIIPKDQQFDLMAIDFEKYKNLKGDTIIRRLDTAISGKPGENKSTTDHFLNKIFHVNLNGFYQVNSEMAKIVYKKIIDFVDSNSIVFDLFGGAGTIGICVSDKAKHVYTVEINQLSYQDALINVKINNTKNVSVINDDANEWILKNKKIKPDIIIIDPARSGLDKKACEAINNSHAKKIIYLSCNIFTQKRDLDLINNYKIIYIQTYDFFPQTYHIENLIVLERKRN